ELRYQQNVLATAYLSNNEALLPPKINACETENINIFIFIRIDDETFIQMYNSRSQEGQPRINTRAWYMLVTQIGLFDRLSPGGEPIIADYLGDSTGSIQLYSQIDEHTYLFLETPKEHIETNASLALQFSIYASLFTLMLGMIVTYFISSRITEPIRRIDAAAKKISNMDFSERCPVTSEDEIGQLSESINIMSDKLKTNIDLLKKDLEREEQTNRMRRDFMANVSHDFKTPLSLIAAYTEAIRDGEGSEEERQEYCDIIIEQSNTMSQFVTRLLSLSKLESGMASFDMSFFSINDVVATVIKNHKLLLQQKEIHYTVQTEDEYIVQGDYNQITQAFTNLLENAIKYVDEKKEIRVAIREADEEGKIGVFVYNSSPPLPDEDQEHLFDEFYKRDKSRGADSKSYGLGLAIFRAIIAGHQGSYGVYNIDEGVVFWFELNKEEL
ncbi:MAG TPA: HAMP domain-containing histidine kinase, partial [Firmicutes bacterium]|nr:HAMP domain-containing histidine kinase [Bacillota bacterium]